MKNGVLFLGVDCSTTGVKAIAWSQDGEAVSEGRTALSLNNPAPDGWEQDALSWWEGTKQAIRGAAEGLGAGGAKRIRALCVTNQRETFVVCGEDGQPLHPALVWMDARCREQVKWACGQIPAGRLHEISGKYPCTTPSMYKFLYFVERLVPDLRHRVRYVLDVHAFVAERMLGRRVTSVASADPMGWVDMRARDWSDELLALSGLSRANMAALAEPGEIMGALRSDVALALGLEPGIPVVAGAGDGQAAALGAGLNGPDEAYLNVGTAIVSGVESPVYRVDRAFRTMMAARPGAYLLETDLKGGTFTLSWLAGRLLGQGMGDFRIHERLAELERKAGELGPGSDGLLMVPYWNGVMNPYWDDEATGMGLGFHGGHGPEHLYRAILEGIAMEQRLHTEGVERACAGAIEKMLLMGGGSSSNLFCQILADVLGRPMVRALSSEATSLGAGMLAAWGAGAFGRLEDAVRAMSGRGAVFEPGAHHGMYQRLYEEVYAKLYPAVSGAMSRLSALRREIQRELNESAGD